MSVGILAMIEMFVDISPFPAVNTIQSTFDLVGF